VYGDIVRQLAPSEIVRILVNSTAHEGRARRVLTQVGVDLGRVEFFRFPTNRGWTRDYGPLFVRRTDRRDLVIARFHFNGWAKYPDWKRDDQIPQLAAKKLGIELVKFSGERKIVLEGGSIDVNGQGTLLTTEECLLDPRVQVRNPRLEREQLEAVFSEWLGATNVLWLGRGIAGDDTHGHIDDVCRFVSPNAVVLCQETNPADPNYTPLQENRERLQDMKLEDGFRPEVLPLPMPDPVIFRRQRLPASYANFYVANRVVLVPTFNDPHDRTVLGMFSEIFQERTVVGIHALDLVWGLGTLHCLTQQQPAVQVKRRTPPPRPRGTPVPAQ